MFDSETLLTGLIIFFARIGDVSLGTVRTIITVQGRSAAAFFLAIFEILIWIWVVSTVVQQVRTQPLLALFYAFGFATGNFLGIALERRIALGHIVLRVFTRRAGAEIARRLRAEGQPVTLFHGEGLQGPIDELYIACRRRDLPRWLETVSREDPEAFWVTDMPRDICRFPRADAAARGGWRSVFKRK